MTEAEKLLAEDLIQLLNRHGFVGFVGTFAKVASCGAQDYTTLRMVHPDYDQDSFKLVERALQLFINHAYDAKAQSYEEGNVIDPDKLNQ